MPILMFFTNQGKVYWQKVYEIPALSRVSRRGRAIVNYAQPDTRRERSCRLCTGSQLRLAGTFLDDGYQERASSRKRSLTQYSSTEERWHHRHQAARR